MTYSPQVMMYADTDSTGSTRIFGLTLAGTSSVPAGVTSGGGTLLEDGVAADLTKDFLYPVSLTNTEVVPY